MKTPWSSLSPFISFSIAHWRSSIRLLLAYTHAYIHILTLLSALRRSLVFVMWSKPISPSLLCHLLSLSRLELMPPLLPSTCTETHTHTHTYSLIFTSLSAFRDVVVKTLKGTLPTSLCRSLSLRAHASSSSFHSHIHIRTCYLSLLYIALCFSWCCGRTPLSSTHYSLLSVTFCLSLSRS